MAGREPAAPTTLDAGDLEGILADLGTAHARFARRVCRRFGRAPARSHRLRWRAAVSRRLGAQDRGAGAAALDQYAPDPTALAAAMGLPAASSGAAHDCAPASPTSWRASRWRIIGSTSRTDTGTAPMREEDAHSVSAAHGGGGGLPPGNPPAVHRDTHQAASQRNCTGAACARSTCSSRRSHGRSMADSSRDSGSPSRRSSTRRRSPPSRACCEALERRLDAARAGTLRLEIMIETPQSILDADGRSPLRAFVAAGTGASPARTSAPTTTPRSAASPRRGRTCAIPPCDFARHMMQVVTRAERRASLGQRDHDAPGAGAPPGRGRGSPRHSSGENTAAVHRAWRLHFDNVRHSLTNGFYQGWDLHPAQLVPRYAAVYDFFGAARDAAAARLRHFVAQATHATLVGDVFDDAATAQGLLNFFVARREQRRADPRRGRGDWPDAGRAPRPLVREDHRAAPLKRHAPRPKRRTPNSQGIPERTSGSALGVRTYDVGSCRVTRCFQQPASPVPNKPPLYRSLYAQVLFAIALGIALGLICAGNRRRDAAARRRLHQADSHADRADRLHDDRRRPGAGRRDEGGRPDRPARHHLLRDRLESRAGDRTGRRQRDRAGRRASTSRRAPPTSRRPRTTAPRRRSTRARSHFILNLIPATIIDAFARGDILQVLRRVDPRRDRAAACWASARAIAGRGDRAARRAGVRDGRADHAAGADRRVRRDGVHGRAIRRRVAGLARRADGGRLSHLRVVRRDRARQHAAAVRSAAWFASCATSPKRSSWSWARRRRSRRCRG